MWGRSCYLTRQWSFAQQKHRRKSLVYSQTFLPIKLPIPRSWKNVFLFFSWKSFFILPLSLLFFPPLSFIKHIKQRIFVSNFLRYRLVCVQFSAHMIFSLSWDEISPGNSTFNSNFPPKTFDPLFTTKFFLVFCWSIPQNQVICDVSVYTRNRNFRLFLSSKAGKREPLLFAPTCNFYRKRGFLLRSWIRGASGLFVLNMEARY